MLRTPRIAFVLWILLGAIVAPVAGQTTTATLEGTVADITGAVLPGATVLATDDATTHHTQTDQDGFYRLPALGPGRYRVIIDLPGFAPASFGAVDLPINRVVQLDVTLQVASRSESVVVAGRITGIDTTTSSSSQVIDSATIDAIPLNGRNYLDLVALTPGVTVNDLAPGPWGDQDTRGSLLGARGGNASFLVDGLTNRDDFRGGAFQDFTQDAIQEFEVIGAGYKAEFGRGSGGVVNVITKSGSNQLQGSAFTYFRNDALDASNVEGAAAPELARADYGLTLGGPVRPGRAWYFGSIEHIRETRQALFPSDIPAALEADEDFTRRPRTNQVRLFGKLTQALGPQRFLQATGSWSRVANTNQLASATSLPSASDQNLTRTFLGSATLSSAVGSQLLLDTSASYRDQRFGQNQSLGDGVSQAVFFLDDGTSFAFGPRYADRQRVDQHYVSARQAASLFIDDRHTAKAGVQYLGTRVNGEYGQFLQSAILATRDSFARFGAASFQAPQGLGFFEPGADRMRLRNQGVGLFLQDDWRIAPSLTLNLGVRYDYDSAFGDAGNLAPRLGVAWALDARSVVRANWARYYDRYRLGVAQRVPALGGIDGRTVAELNYPRLVADALPIPVVPGPLGLLGFVTGDPFILHKMFGIPEDAVIHRDSIQALTGLTSDEFLAALNGFLATLPLPFSPVDFSPSTGYLRQDASATLQDMVTLSSPFQTPYNDTMTLGYERDLGAGVTLGATYAHRRIRNVLGIRLTNLAFESRTAGSVITTDGGPLQRTYGPWYDGDYDAFVLRAEKRADGRYQLQASYTFARGEDNLLNPNLGIGIVAQGGGAVPTDSLDLEVDRGRSDLVTPHTLVLSGLSSWPGDVHVSGVLRATSGQYFSATSVPGRDYDGDGLLSARAPGTRRNGFRGPSTLRLDLRVEKRLSLGAGSTASVLAEFFNVTNARNPILIDTAYLEGAPGASFGTVRVPMPGREAQIGLRLRF